VKITGPITALFNPGTRDAAELLRQLRPGQVLEARVIDVPRVGVARLQIGLAELLARTRAPLTPGTELRLAVTGLTPQPELKVLQPARETAPRDLLLRTALPRQLPLREVLDALTALTRPAEARLPSNVRQAVEQVLARAVPAQELDAASVRRAFLGSGLFLEPRLARGGPPPASDLKFDLLALLRLLQGAKMPVRQPPSATAAPPAPRPAGAPSPPVQSPAVQRYLGLPGEPQRPAEPRPIEHGTARPPSAPGPPGPPAERPVAAGQPPAHTPRAPVAGQPAPGPPPAAPLPTAQASPEPLLERLLGLVQGAIARVQTHQAASLPGDGQERPPWQFELPLAFAGHAEDVWVRIEHREPDARQLPAEPGSAPWTVTLSFDLGSHGRVQARLSVDRERVAGTFWCERPETERRFAGGFAVLQGALQRAGLEVAELRSVLGEPAERLDLPRLARGLLDARA
jgi:hypothetical protein